MVEGFDKHAQNLNDWDQSLDLTSFLHVEEAKFCHDSIVIWEEEKLDFIILFLKEFVLNKTPWNWKKEEIVMEEC